MGCDILPRQTAVWSYAPDEKTTIKLSDEAAFILMEQKTVKMSKIKVYHCKNIEIEDQRWDPLSATGSSLLDTFMGLRSDGKTMVASVQKAQTLQRDNSDGAGFAMGLILDLPVAMADGLRCLLCMVKSGLKAGGKSLGRFLPGFTGILVDPIQGAVDDRAKGFAKGFVSGTLGVLFKPGAAMLGFVGYPLLGVYKSISHMHATEAQSKILLARQI
ncbi:glycosyltransferase family 1 protein [Hyaloscypha variabilis]|uniref:Glycosyltransferase family 1 protein n=1 Tax=Hyaloscypha variabilis (strain UAMH 11265 / GT02V1 / F) TaxID=1149755 RepID=A0A2J6RUL9_HYAVF|nr:glycosyltransferase family 1 protein [Hyaloscypha variabilis F]